VNRNKSVHDIFLILYVDRRLRGSSTHVGLYAANGTNGIPGTPEQIASPAVECRLRTTQKPSGAIELHGLLSTSGFCDDQAVNRSRPSTNLDNTSPRGPVGFSRLGQDAASALTLQSADEGAALSNFLSRQSTVTTIICGFAGGPM